MKMKSGHIKSHDSDMHVLIFHPAIHLVVAWRLNIWCFCGFGSITVIQPGEERNVKIVVLVDEPKPPTGAD